MNMHVVGAQGPTKRLVVVADNSLIVEAIAIGLRKSGAFKLLGHVNARTGSIQSIVEAGPDVVLIDDLDGSDESIELVARIKAEQERVAVIVLATSMDPEWLDAIFAAGAAGAISKATHPAALATLVRETIDGHVVHVYKSSSGVRAARPAAVAAEHSPLTSRELEVLQLVAAGADQRRDRPEAVGDRADGEVPPLQRVSKARSRQSHRGQSLRPRQRPGSGR